jgi:hypothetical protein
MNPAFDWGYVNHMKVKYIGTKLRTVFSFLYLALSAALSAYHKSTLCVAAPIGSRLAGIRVLRTHLCTQYVVQ